MGAWLPFIFLGKEIKLPMWISSMTGGAPEAMKINQNLARAANAHGLGMGLGSCRILLDNKKYLPDFDVRDIIGDHLPLFANIGIAQIEKMQARGDSERLVELVQLLRADGLIIHVNPAQEFLQEEGDRLEVPPIETIIRFLEEVPLKTIVKEVGQGMGPQSLRQLLQLPIEAIETASFGGTNFARLELKRKNNEQGALLEPLAHIGHTAPEMLETLNELTDSETDIKCKHIIFSGGIKNFLDGYDLISRSKLPAVFGQASGFLHHARDSYESLDQYITQQVQGLAFAKAWLKPKSR
jgi:isopentenyl-diphosphate delta-isomerase